MHRRIPWFALCAVVTLAALPPARAAEGPNPAAAGTPPAATAPESAGSTAGDPTGSPTVAPGSPQGQRKSKEPPSCGETLLRWMGYGAAAGLTVGLINGHDELEATLLGAASPILAGLTLAMLASAGPRFLRPEEARAADLYLLGSPLRGKPREFLPGALGGAALAVAADQNGSGNRSGRGMLRYVVRW